MSELLFECYGAPSVCYGVDALFSYYYNKKRLPLAGRDGLIIASGNLATHHLLIADDKLDGSAVKRFHHHHHHHHTSPHAPHTDTPHTHTRADVAWLRYAEFL
jgi:actin-related protein